MQTNFTSFRNDRDERGWCLRHRALTERTAYSPFRRVNAVYTRLPSIAGIGRNTGLQFVQRFPDEIASA